MDHRLGNPAGTRATTVCTQQKTQSYSYPECDKNCLAWIFVAVLLGLIINFTDLFGRFIIRITDLLGRFIIRITDLPRFSYASLTACSACSKASAPRSMTSFAFAPKLPSSADVSCLGVSNLFLTLSILSSLLDYCFSVFSSSVTLTTQYLRRFIMAPFSGFSSNHVDYEIEAFHHRLPPPLESLHSLSSQRQPWQPWSARSF